MTLEQFKETLDNYKFIMERLDELANMGFDLIDGQYQIIAEITNLLEISIESNYGKDGTELVFYFIFDADYGNKKLPNIPNNIKKLWRELESNFKVEKLTGNVL